MASAKGSLSYLRFCKIEMRSGREEDEVYEIRTFEVEN